MMKSRLAMLFGFICVSLLAYTVYASAQQPVWQWSGLTRPPDHWWTIATLMDAYYGFITFYVWVHYKETRATVRIGWFLAIMLLGNMAMSSYVLRQLWRLRPGETMGDLLCARNA
ncbi:MAG: DUF1475 family protein [Steroidobacteraceae bacterium]